MGSPAALNAYRRGIENLHLLYGPGEWGAICTADELVRTEQWDILLETGLEDETLEENAGVWSHVISLSAYVEAGEGRMATWWSENLVWDLNLRLHARVAANQATVQTARPPPASAALALP